MNFTMKGISVVLFVVLSAAVRGQVDECPTEQETNWEIEQLLRHEDCNKFYKCTFGKPVEYSCYSGLYFNLETWQCDWPHNVDCTGRNDPALTTLAPVTLEPTTPETTPEPSTPEPTTPEPSSPEPTTPEPSTPEPTTPEPSTPEPTRPVPIISSTTHVPECEVEVWPETQAPETERPEPTTPEPTTPLPITSSTTHVPECEVEVWPETPAPETEAPEPEGPGTETPEPEAPGTETPEPESPITETPEPESPETEAPEDELPDDFLQNGCPVDPHIHWLLPNKEDCNLFYYCVWGEKVLRECPPTLHFNPVIQVCDWPQAAGCAVSANKHLEARRQLLQQILL